MSEIIGITGLPGAGKTYLAVRWLYRMACRRPGLCVVTNTPLVLPRGARVEFIDDLSDAFSVSDCVLFLDEVHLWMFSREWQKRGTEYVEFLSQLRKRRVYCIWTSQDVSSVDKVVRERTLVTYWVSSAFKVGFFVWKAFLGCPTDIRTRSRGWYSWGVYVFSPVIASCYDTGFMVR